MRYEWPAEMQYLVCLVCDRWQRITADRDHDRDYDRGVETLEVIIWAAVLTVAAVAAGAFIVSKIQAHQEKIK